MAGEYKDEIITMVKAIRDASGKQSKELAAEMGIVPIRFSTLLGQGDMKLSTFIRLLEVSGQSIEINPTVNGEVIRIAKKNKCVECPYKLIAEQMDEAACVKIDEQSNKLVIEV